MEKDEGIVSSFTTAAHHGMAEIVQVLVGGLSGEGLQGMLLDTVNGHFWHREAPARFTFCLDGEDAALAPVAVRTPDHAAVVRTLLELRADIGLVD